eukprot:1157540-Pelagomonas_calceolata.AAC.9
MHFKAFMQFLCMPACAQRTLRISIASRSSGSPPEPLARASITPTTCPSVHQVMKVNVEVADKKSVMDTSAKLCFPDRQTRQVCTQTRMPKNTQPCASKVGILARTNCAHAHAPLAMPGSLA